MCENQNQSWLDMLESSNSSVEDTKNKIKTSAKVQIKQRELEIEIFDSKNERKFDKLVSEKKIKSPFKRRLSNDKLNGNDDDDNAEDGGKAEKKMKPNEEEDESEKKRKCKKFRNDSTSDSSTYSSNCNLASLNQRELETDQATLDRRQKQIDYGKNTVGYENYVKLVPKDKRTREHPKTPPRQLKYSRRAWEGLVKSWRKKLHSYDDNAEEENE